MKLQNLSIKQIIALFFILFITFIGMAYGLFLLSGAFLRQDAARVEVSRQAEKILGQMPYRASLIIGGDNESKIALQNLIFEYEDKLNILEKGRKVNIFASEVIVRSIAGTKQLIKFNKLLDDWRLYKRNLTTILNQVIEIDSVVLKTAKKQEKINDTLIKETPITVKAIEKIENMSVQKAYINLIETTGNIQNVHNELTELLVTEYASKQTTLHVSIFFMIVLLLGFLIGGYTFFGSRFIEPLNKIASVTQEIALGDVNQKIIYDRKDEIGTLASNINTLVQNLKRTSEFAINIGEGQLQYPFQARSSKDILGHALLKMQENLLKVAQEDQRRNWANEGFALFVNILRVSSEILEENIEKTIEDLAYEIISNLVKYVKAEQGALFLISTEGSEEKFLELKAAYAYNRRKYETTRIEIGQGLVGQAVLERDILHLDRLPEDYTKVTSGLGDAPPRYLLIVPMIYNNKEYGAIEIASFKKLEDYEIAFIEKVSENIASTFAFLQNAIENKRLALEEAQVIEQLRTQEQIMHQNLLQLEKAQEEAEKNRSELEKMKESLEQQIQEQTLELRQKEAQLSEALRLASLGPWQLDVTAQTIIATDELYELLRTNKDLEGGYRIPTQKFVEKFIVEKYYSTFNEKIAEAIQSKDPTYESSLECQMRRTNGDIRDIIVSIKRIADPNTEVTTMLYGTIQDITRQKRIEEQIRLQRDALEKQQIEQQKFVAMVENATDFVIMMNPNEEIIYANKVGQQLFGADNYLTKRLYFKNFFSEKNWEKVQKEVMPSLKTNGFWEGELEMINLKTNSTAYMSGNIVAIKNAQGEITAIATIMRDVTEKQKILHEIEESNFRMKAILDSTTDEIYSIDKNFNILSFNEKWAKFIIEETGKRPQVGMNLLNDFEFKRKELPELLKQQFTRLFEQGPFSYTESFKVFEKKKVKVKGKEVEQEVLAGEYFFQRYYNPLYDYEGNLIGGVSFTQDITPIKKVEQEIQRSENRLKAIAESTHEAIVIHEKGYIREVNTAFTKITGYTAQEVINQYLFNLFAPETKAISVINMQLGYSKPYEGVLIHKDGREIPIEIQGRVVSFEDQKIRIFAIRDISEQKAFRDALQKSKDTLQKIIDTLPQSVFWKDRESKFLGCNRRFLQMVGVKDVSEIIGKTDLEIWPNLEEAEIYIRSDKKVMETGVAELDVLQTRVLPNGQTAWLKVSKIPFQDADGNIIGIIGTYQDVTEQKKAEENILASKERLRKQIETLTMLGSQKLQEVGIKEYASEINKAIAETLDIPRVGIWEFKSGVMNCIDMFIKEEGIHVQGLQMSQEDYPIFFENLYKESYIIAHPAQISPITKELTPKYLSEASITSMLIYPIRVVNKLKGMLTCEHIRTPREWSLEEQSFISSMLDLITLKMEETERISTDMHLDKTQIIGEQIIEKSKESILAVDENEKIVLFNTKMEVIFHNLYGVQIQKGMPWTALFESNPEDLAHMRKDWYHAIQTKQPYETEHIFGKGEKRSKLRYMIEPILINDMIAGVVLYVRRGSALLTIER